MFAKIIKNPVIIALVVGIIIYTYMSWTRKAENEKRLKKGKKIKSENKYDNIIIPIVGAVITWFIAYGYFTHVNKQPDNTVPAVIQNNTIQPMPMMPQTNFKLAPESNSTSASLVLVNKTNGGITLPSALPDVFI
jgi:hypothetical protein